MVGRGYLLDGGVDQEPLVPGEGWGARSNGSFTGSRAWGAGPRARTPGTCVVFLLFLMCTKKENDVF